MKELELGIEVICRNDRCTWRGKPDTLIIIINPEVK